MAGIEGGNYEPMEDEVICDINGEEEIIGGKDVFPEMSDEAFCNMTERTMREAEEQRERQQEELELQMLLEGDDFRG